jgi:hypothetical protein
MNIVRMIISQLFLLISNNRALQEYTALKALEMLNHIASKTENTIDDKIVIELKLLLEKLEIIETK